MAKAAKKESKTFTTAELAEELGIESKTLRVWLRSHDYGVGRGKQYKFTKKQRKHILDTYREPEETEDLEFDED